MLREKLVQHHPHKPHEFRWRGREISRLEGLGDAVFWVTAAVQGKPYEDRSSFGVLGCSTPTWCS